MLERQSTTTSVLESNEHRRLSQHSARSIDRNDSNTINTSSPKGQTDKHLSTDRKYQTIPSLKERFARSGINGECVIHGVRPGETLSEIAMRYYGSCNDDLLQTLKKTNDIKETDTVKAGWELIIPPQTVDGEARPNMAMANRPAIRLYPRPGEAGHVSSDVTENIDSNNAVERLEHRKAVDESPIARFQQGIISFERKDYPAAYNAFASLSSRQKPCDSCEEYLKEIEERATLHFENGLSYFRKRNYAKAIPEFEKARIPTVEPQATEYLFKSHFEMALKKFLQYKRSGIRSYHTQARNSLNQARKYRSEYPDGCMEYEEIFKKTHYNNGIKYFTDNDGEGMEKALQEWEKVRFIDPDYKDVSENITQAKALLKKLNKIKDVS